MPLILHCLNLLQGDGTVFLSSLLRHKSNENTPLKIKISDKQKDFYSEHQLSGQISGTVGLASYQIDAVPTISRALWLREWTSRSKGFKFVYKHCFLLAE